MKYFLQLIILFFGLSYGASVSAKVNITEKEAENWAAHKGEELLQVLAETDLDVKYAALDRILLQDVDLDYAAKFVVGKYWRKMTEEQKKRYVPAFKRYATALYKKYPLNFGEGMIKYQVEKAIPDKDVMNVWCLISLVGNDNSENNNATSGFKVLFVLTNNNGHIQLRDLKIGESSLLFSYRDKFYKMIHEDSDDEIDWFLDDLENMAGDEE